MDFTISLAHFCEIHGPTSIFCTHASPAPCGHCDPCVTPPEDSHVPLPYRSRPSQRTGHRPSTLDSPPNSPRSSPRNTYFPSYTRSEASLGSHRTDGSNDVDSDACENCQMTLPKKCSDRLASADDALGRADHGRRASPPLRTTMRYPVRGSLTDDMSNSGSSDASDSEQSKSFGSNSSQSYPDSTPASPTFSAQGTHPHTLSYVSTSKPQSPETFSLLRHTCIRTLSNETLPMGKASGPLFFGDSHAGYTIAYVFRLQDPRSRGAKRTYALIALAGRDDMRATKARAQVSRLFETIANWIVQLAERELAKESAASQYLTPSRPLTAVASPAQSNGSNAWLSSASSTSMATRNITPVSSFLSAKRLDPDGFPRVSREVMKAKSFVELVGMDDFFVELHRLFCHLLHSLVMQFGQAR